MEGDEVIAMIETLSKDNERLKKRQRSLSVALGSLCVFIVAATLSGWAAEEDGTIKARKLELVAPNGKVRVSLEASDSFGLIQVLDEEDRVRFRATSFPIGRGVTLHDVAGRRRAWLSEEGLQMADETGDPRIALIVSTIDDVFLSFDRDSNELYRIPPKDPPTGPPAKR